VIGEEAKDMVLADNILTMDHFIMDNIKMTKQMVGEE